MKVVILAGGFGTRISEESHLRPKPMIEIGEKPILWHIMKYYSAYGFNDFIICCGYKQFYIKEYFANYFLYNSDITFDFSGNTQKTIIHDSSTEAWRVTLVDTGLSTMTGGRIKRVKQYIGDEPFMMTYGDGLSNINLDELLAYHKEHGKLATMSSVRPESRFGNLEVKDGQVVNFREKDILDSAWINCGFMVLEPGVIDEIEGDSTVFEKDVLVQLAVKKELMAYQHKGFWQCMDTMRDKIYLDKLWETDNAPWKVWKN